MNQPFAKDIKVFGKKIADKYLRGKKQSRLHHWCNSIDTKYYRFLLSLEGYYVKDLLSRLSEIEWKQRLFLERLNDVLGELQ